jgi:hypothetical protein
MAIVTSPVLTRESEPQLTTAVAWAILGVSALIAFALLLPSLEYVPMWDGRAYAECTVDAALNRLAPSYLRCYGHPAYFYLGILSAAQLSDAGNTAALFAVGGLTLGAAAMGFHRLLRQVFPSPDHAIDVAILTAAFVVQPSFLASVIQPSLDLPVLAGTLWCSVLLIGRRWVWCAAVATAMVFSKETGVMLYGVLLGLFVLRELRRDGRSLPARLRALVPMAPTVVPLAVFFGYLVAFRLLRPGQAAMWTVGSSAPLLQEFLIPRVDVYMASYLAMLFLLGFAWIPTAFLSIDAAVGIVRGVRGAPRRTVVGADERLLGFLTATGIAFFIALTRFVTFSNVRYLMPAIALLLALAYVAVVRLRVPPTTRRVVLGVFAVLVAVSSVRTIDPVSRRLWGTFQFGSHQMLDMTGITGECCGNGRDQAAYSLEFARIHDVMDTALAGMAPDTLTVIGVPDHMNWFTVVNLDRVTKRRTLRRVDSFVPTVMTRPQLVAAPEPPQSVVYLALPNAKDPTALASLATRYEIGPERRFERDGYVMSAYHLTARSPRPLTP